jgi:hypothetical protein
MIRPSAEVIMTFDDELRRWEKQTRQPVLKRFPERKTDFTTSSGIPLPPVMAPSVPDPVYPDKLGLPGEYPFTRGVQPTMYRGRFWTMRQYAGYASAEESNQRYRYLLEQGQTGLSVAFDLPTQIGYGDIIPRHPAGKSLHQHDHQRSSVYSSGNVHSRRPPPGGRDEPIARHDPKRYP